MLQGTNLTGGETFYQQWSGTSPQVGTHYLFVADKDIDTCVAAGMNCFRLLFGWEAYEYSPEYRAALNGRVNYILSKNCTVVLDIHPGDANYGAAYYGVKIPGFSGGFAVGSRLAKTWQGLATIYQGQPRVQFGLMNEPNGVKPADWFAAAQLCIDSIRAVGNTSTVWCPGADWDAASNWTAANGPAWNLKDTANNLGVQVHMYFDANNGGGGTDIVSASIGVERLKNTVDWARGKGLKVLLGEVGLQASQPLAKTAWGNLVAYMAQEQATVAGWLWWAYGPPIWWSKYQFSLCSSDGAQMKLAFPAPVPPPVDTRDQQIVDLTARVIDLSNKASDLKTMVVNLQSENARWTDRIKTLEARIADAKVALG
ncbi:glycoside hydrolase family 5 protein [Acidithiobacillus sp.]|uniref:glycoside hydrolase family 5 protein n=1 Tax=Acidithiobacillus sp. TaxID=1872118 RepID=UPI0025860B33|nr:glycoside hydrolase family 5 protein [Acidithiobacillus sp.]MDD5374426.1 glycoside hydrolase family 5 protein [Acidithiobacillus sp.]